jgi:hypothetical protein
VERAGAAARSRARTAVEEAPASVACLKAAGAAESLGHRRTFTALRDLSRELEALRPVIEGNGGARRLHRSVATRGEAVLYQMRFKMRCLGMLERRNIRVGELFRSAGEKFDVRVGVIGNVFYRFAPSACGLEDAIFQIERSFSGHVMRMKRNKRLGAVVLYPGNGAVVMPVRAGNPGVAPTVRYPCAGVTDRPVIWRSECARIDDRVPASCRVPCDHAPDSVWRAGEGLYVFCAQDGGGAASLERSRG